MSPTKCVNSMISDHVGPVLQEGGLVVDHKAEPPDWEQNLKLIGPIMSPPTFSCTWVQFYKRGVGRWPRGWTPWPAYGWINVAPEPQVTIPLTVPSVFSKSGIRISSRQLLRRGSKRIYWTSKCFRHAIKHLGLCVKHTLTLRPRNFLFFSAPQTSAHYSLAPDRQPVFIIRPEQNWWNGQRLKYVCYCCCSLTIASVIIFEPFFFTQTLVLENSSSCK